jgi:undecaprenyl-diphosphatase
VKFKEAKEKISRIIRQNIIWIIAILMLIIAFVIMDELLDNEIYKFDDYIYRYISIIISPKMTVFFKMITNLGDATVVITTSILFLLFVKNKIFGKIMIFNLAIITTLNVIIKNLVDRPRPTGFRLIDESGYSFPSGHSMVSMAFYGLIIYLVYRYVKNINLKYILIAVLSILIILIGISRVYLGVHFASDIVEGFCISIAYLILFIKILTRNKIFIRENKI